MKVRCVVTVDIDPEAWDMNYGTGTDRETVRTDVREYVWHTIHDQLSMVDVLVKGEQ